MSFISNIFTVLVLFFGVLNGNALTSSSHGQSDGYEVDQRTGHRYKFHPIGATWRHALKDCWLEGGYLAIINSQDEANFVKNLFHKYPTNNITASHLDVASIGFFDPDKSGTWITIRGKTLAAAGYSRFDDGQSDNNKQYCGGIFRNGRLIKFWCDKTAPYICEKDF